MASHAEGRFILKALFHSSSPPCVWFLAILLIWKDQSLQVSCIQGLTCSVKRTNLKQDANSICQECRCWDGCKGFRNKLFKRRWSRNHRKSKDDVLDWKEKKCVQNWLIAEEQLNNIEHIHWPLSVSLHMRDLDLCQFFFPLHLSFSPLSHQIQFWTILKPSAQMLGWCRGCNARMEIPWLARATSFVSKENGREKWPRPLQALNWQNLRSDDDDGGGDDDEKLKPEKFTKRSCWRYFETLTFRQIKR